MKLRTKSKEALKSICVQTREHGFRFKNANSRSLCLTWTKGNARVKLKLGWNQGLDVEIKHAAGLWVTKKSYGHGAEASNRDYRTYEYTVAFDEDKILKAIKYAKKFADVQPDLPTLKFVAPKHRPGVWSRPFVRAEFAGVLNLKNGKVFEEGYEDPDADGVWLHFVLSIPGGGRYQKVIDVPTAVRSGEYICLNNNMHFRKAEDQIILTTEDEDILKSLV